MFLTLDAGVTHPFFNIITVLSEFARSCFGICINPLSDFAVISDKESGSSLFLSFAVSDKHGYLPFKVVSGSNGWEDQLSSISSSARGYRAERLKDYRRLKGSMLYSFNHLYHDIDFMSLDDKGNESSALSSLGSCFAKILLSGSKSILWFKSIAQLTYVNGVFLIDPYRVLRRDLLF